MGWPKGQKKNIATADIPKGIGMVDDKQNVPHGTTCSECKHGKEVHYDGLKGHCNTLGCVCDGFYS